MDIEDARDQFRDDWGLYGCTTDDALRAYTRSIDGSNPFIHNEFL